MKHTRKQTVGKAFSVLGLLMMVAVILVYLPLNVPKWMGYDIYHITSGSMEPEISTGSIIFVEAVRANELQAGEVIVYHSGQDGETTVTHRVVENQKENYRLVTKGDANAGNDVLPVPYQNVVGRVAHHVPGLGFVVPVFAGTQGKLSLLAFLAAGVLFRMVGGRLMDEEIQEETA